LGSLARAASAKRKITGDVADAFAPRNRGLTFFKTVEIQRFQLVNPDAAFRAFFSGSFLVANRGFGSLFARSDSGLRRLQTGHFVISELFQHRMQ
jgi:hypothetical protein